MTRRPPRRAFALSAAILATSLAFASGARAQKPDAPTVLFTAKSAGELIADLRYLFTSVGNPDDPQIAQALGALDMLKDPANLQGLDPSKPLGAFGSLPRGDEPPSAVIFLPVLNAKALLDAMNQNGLAVEPDNTAPGFTHKLTLPNVPIPLFITEGKGYLYFSLAAVGADALKAMNPASLLPKRPGAGDLSLTLRLDRLSPEIRQQFNALVEQAMAPQRERQPNEDDGAMKLRLSFLKAAQDAAVAIVRDGKELSLDVLIDPKTEFVGLELNSSAASGTPYAAVLRKISALKGRFRGLTADAAVAGSITLPIGQGLRDALGPLIDQVTTKVLADPKVVDNAVARKIVNQVADTARATLGADTLDLAAALQGPAPSGRYAAAAAMAVKGGKSLDSALREAMKAASPEEKKNFTADFGKTADGTPIHKMVNTQPQANPTAAAAFGDNLVFAAFGETVAAFGIGTDGQAALKSAFVAGKAPASGAGAGGAPQVDLSIAASRIAGIADTPAGRDAMKAAAADVFGGKAAKKDRVSLTVKGNGDSMTLRIGSDVPALKFLARLGQLQGKGNQ